MKMEYTKQEHKRNIINGIASSLVVGVFIGVLYDTKSWMASIFVATLYAIVAFWVSWLFVKDKRKK